MVNTDPIIKMVSLLNLMSILILYHVTINNYGVIVTDETKPSKKIKLFKINIFNIAD